MMEINPTNMTDRENCICINRHPHDYVGPHDDDCPKSRILGVGRIEDLSGSWRREPRPRLSDIPKLEDFPSVKRIIDDPDYDQIVRDFIKSHVTAYSMIPGDDGWYRHQKGPTCPHCNALEALDKIQEQHREQVGQLLQMIQELGIRHQTELSSKMREATSYIEELEKNLYEASRNLVSCKAELHDQGKHELGLQCSELEDRLTKMDSIATQLIKILDDEGYPMTAGKYEKLLKEARDG